MSNNITLNPESPLYSKQQIDQLMSQHFINKIDQHLMVISSFKIFGEYASPGITLLIDIYYNSQPSGNLSFNLHNYDFEEVLALAKNIRASEFILHEIDNLLSGDVVE